MSITFQARSSLTAVTGSANRTAVSFDNPTANIEATNLGNDVIVGDCVEVSGSGFNDRGFLVLEVVDADNVRVYPAPANEGPGATCRARYNDCYIDIDNETSVDAATIESAIGNSELFRRVTTTPSIGSPINLKWRIYAHRCRTIQVTPPTGGVCTFTSLREVWYFDADGEARSTGGGGYAWVFREDTSAGSTGEVRWNVGELTDSGDIRSGKNGSIFLNGSISSHPSGSPNNLLGRFLVTNSLMSQDSDGIAYLNDDENGNLSRLANSILVGTFQMPTGNRTLDTIKNLILEGPLFIIGQVTNAEDLTVTEELSGTFGSSVSVTSESTFSGIEISDSVFLPLVLLFNSVVNLLNPKEDYSLSSLFNVFSLSAARKSFTFNPTFVDYNEGGGPQPISGATVSVEKVADGHILNISTYSAAGPYTVTINGTPFSVTAAGSLDLTRTALINAINAGSEPVTATNGLTDAQFGATSFSIIADSPNTPFDIQVSSPSNFLVLNPAAVAGGALLLGEDHTNGALTGSPFTTDVNGRINSGDGVELTTEVRYTNLGTIRLFYLITIEKAGFPLTETTLRPTGQVESQFPIRSKKMGVI